MSPPSGSPHMLSPPSGSPHMLSPPSGSHGPRCVRRKVVVRQRSLLADECVNNLMGTNGASVKWRRIEEGLPPVPDQPCGLSVVREEAKFMNAEGIAPPTLREVRHHRPVNNSSVENAPIVVENEDILSDKRMNSWRKFDGYHMTLRDNHMTTRDNQ